MAKPSPDTNLITVRLYSMSGLLVLREKERFVKPQDTLAMFVKKFREDYKLTSANDSVFFFINGTFSPSLDTTFETLLRCYPVKLGDKECVEMQCCLTPAYG